MIPASISASAIKAFEECPAMFEAAYVQRVRVQSGGPGSAGDLGSCIHEVLEWWVDHHKDDLDPSHALLTIRLKTLAPQYRIDAQQIKVATAMIEAWHDRWIESPPHEVLSVEVKEQFIVPISSNVAFPVNYIWDRCDRREDGSIEVIDYKSWMSPLTGEEIFTSIQARIYALAAAIKYKNEKPPYIWVTFDQLRYGPTSVRFTRADLSDIWKYLVNVATRIFVNTGETEVVGPACRWCVRAVSCVSLSRAMDAGTMASIRDPATAALKLAQLSAALNAAKEMIPQLKEVLHDHLEEEGTLASKFENGVTARITPKRERNVNSLAAARVIGAERAIAIGKIGVGDYDLLMKDPEITDEMKAELALCVTEEIKSYVSASFPKQ